MKVYFTASITYFDEYEQVYRCISGSLRKMGHEVNDAHVFRHKIDEIKRHTDEQRIRDYEEMLRWIKETDILVCEVSFPSTITTGHVMTRALEQGKPVLAIYNAKSAPPLLLGLESERFILAEYNMENLEKVIKEGLKELMSLPDQRFTMLLPSGIVSYLDGVAEKGISRSEYIRSLILLDKGKKK